MIDEAKHDAFRYDFTPKELMYFLFGRKVCPECGGKLHKQKFFETRRGSDFPSSQNPILRNNAVVKYYRYRYICKKCGEAFPLSELANH